MIWVHLLLLGVCEGAAVYTGSYAKWEWQQGNRAGGIALWVIAAAAAVLPVARLVMGG